MNYANSEVKIEVHEKYIKGLTTTGTYETLYLYSDFNLSDITSAKEITLSGDGFLALSYNQKIRRPNVEQVELEFERTKVYWMSWVSRSHIFEDYKSQITRSALTLKMLSYESTGAILAAATTSLPESIGEVRNWDYRFCWIRDASMTIRTLTRIGQHDTAKKFLKFILGLIPYKDEEIQIMYGIHGQKILTEKELPWLAGYENSKPVRIGNDAYHQKQNDIYGILLDAIEQSLSLFESDIATQEHVWTIVRTIARHVAAHWTQPDMGIWELRTKKRHFTFSKVLCWVAMDRAVKIAKLLGQHHHINKWSALRETIKSDILDHGWSETAQAFTQSYGEDSLDASTLLMEPYGFIHPKDPKYVSTVLKTYEKLCVNGLTYRYLNEDDFGKPKSSFTICSFWMIRAMHQIGKTEIARNMFDQILSYSNHLGLLSEDIDIATKRLLGNFPQAYSHLALIDTALILTGQESSWADIVEPSMSGTTLELGSI
jgi:alpha,alpha-trehalase